MEKIINSLFICLCFFSISCYTIIEITPTKKNNTVYNNHRILGIWDTKVLLRDNNYTRIIGKNNSNSTWITKRLELIDNGNIILYSHWEKIDSKVYHGTFALINDTIKIKLFDISLDEIYRYKVDSKNLILKKIETGYRSNNLVSGDNSSKWVRVF